MRAKWIQNYKNIVRKVELYVNSGHGMAEKFDPVDSIGSKGAFDVRRKDIVRSFEVGLLNLSSQFNWIARTCKMGLLIGFSRFDWIKKKF